VFGLVMVLFPDSITAPFGRYTAETEFAPIRDKVAVLLRFVAVFTFFDGIAIVFGSAVRGAGDTRFSFLYTLATSWSLMLLPTFLVWWLYGGNLLASWWACTVYVIVLGIGFLLRFQAGRWKTMSVIERLPRPSETAAEVAPESQVAVESI
jgi:MATE family multidrug resistance protein